MVNAVFPPPLGPTRRKVGVFVVAAACLYKKVCSNIGRVIATTNVMRMVVRFGESAFVSKLSSSYHAMADDSRAHQRIEVFWSYSGRLLINTNTPWSWQGRVEVA